MLRSSWAAPGAAALFAQLVFFAAPASAADGQSIEAASKLFERGEDQQRRGDFKGAAASFARADELVPDAAALEAALRASVLADDAVLGMTLAERAGRSPPPARLNRVIESARTKFAKRVGRLRVRCAACTATVDAQPMDVTTPRWLSPGDHEVVIQAAGRSDRRTLRIDAGSSTDVVPIEGPGTPTQQEIAASTSTSKLPSPREEPAATAAPASGLSPVWFWVALGTTAAAGGVTIASAVDTTSKYDAFKQRPSSSAADSGKAAETRTNVLAGVTAALGLVTAGVGLFAVRWSAAEPPPVTATLDITPDRAVATLQTTF